MNVYPFDIRIDQSQLDKIMHRVKAYDWHEMPEIAEYGDRWAYGADMAYMQELCSYWHTHYDTRRMADILNAFDNFKAPVSTHDGEMNIHFIKENGSGTNPKTLLLTHGWPGSVLEFVDVIRPLAHPEEFGGNAEDGITVILPSLPGYGFSDKPKTPIGPIETARIWDTLMRENLGIADYVAQGGDWGSVITGCLGLNHSTQKGGGCAAIHLNMYGLRALAAIPESEEEKNWAARFEASMQAEGGYFHEQSTKPQTLSYAMMDSPVGACAWIVEKFHGWSRLPEKDGTRHIESCYTKDQLLDNVMLYLLTRTFNTATWFYRAFGENPAFIPPDDKVAVPTGIANFFDPFFAFPSRRMVECGYNVVHWQDYPDYGHFAALESGMVFVKEIQDFMQKL